jgi:hypothetical protein
LEIQYKKEALELCLDRQLLDPGRSAKHAESYNDAFDSTIISILVDFDFCIKHLQGFKEHMEEEQQKMQVMNKKS